MTQNKKYWKGEEELQREPSFVQSGKDEFSEGLPLHEVLSEPDLELASNRRDFLKMFGFSVSAVALAACNKTPVRNIVPYLVKPDDVTPGVPNYYSSTCGYTGAPIEVKVREGRPIKIDGNKRSSAYKGGLSVAGQACILELYDNERFKKPRKAGADSTWAEVDKDITSILENIAARNGKVALVTNSINSPSTLGVIADFKIKYTNVEHLTYDAISYHGIIEGNKQSFGKAIIPSYNFDKADVIVGIEADFIGNWLMADRYMVDYTSRRNPANGMSQHIQFESVLSLTGSNADIRYPFQASNHGILLNTLYNAIAKKSGAAPLPVVNTADVAGGGVAKTADALWNAKGKALVVSGSNNPNHQIIVNAINLMLDSYSSTININEEVNKFQGNDTNIENFVSGLIAGTYDGVIFYNTNLVYSHPKGKAIKEALKKVKLSISTCLSIDETGNHCQFITPDNHYLESWNDHQQTSNSYSFTQPTISPVFDTRQMQVSLMKWAGLTDAYGENKFVDTGIFGEQNGTSPFYNYIRTKWAVSDTEFNKMLHDGAYDKAMAAAQTPALGVNITETAQKIDHGANAAVGQEIILIERTGLLDGILANNPLVQELPDPISKVTWHNYAAISKAFAAKANIADNDVIKITVNETSISLPALIQPGQANGTISIHLGYGRTVGGKVAKDRGANAFTLIDTSEGFKNYVLTGAKVEATSEKYELAKTQTHHHIEGRDIVRETTLTEFKDNPKAGNQIHKPQVVSLWYEHDYRKDGAPNHLWGMAIDMNKCTGCAACIVSCSIENNVPVVGEVEVLRRREMHWLRIDRYFTFNNVNDVNYKDELSFPALESNYEKEKITKEKALEAIDKVEQKAGKYEYLHYENVSVVHQPMMCQHCGSAPCETVCPVLATTHSTEGLNQMTYNRCIGTKYCGNNCPYKVRRFNWFRYNDNQQFDFHFSNDLGKMVINPDVTVRTRGVMEKCSFCVQRIQASKLTAKRENRYLKDGDVKTACQRACPADAIMFGDLHDKDSEVSKLFNNDRSYSVLEELNVKPSVRYMTKVRNI